MAAPGSGEAPRADPAPPGAGDAALRRKLVWLTLFRLVTITVLLGGIALTTWQAGLEVGEAAGPLYGLIVLTYAASLVTALLLRRGRGLPAVAYAQVGLDVARAAGVVAVTGRTESVFVFLFKKPGNAGLCRCASMWPFQADFSMAAVLLPLSAMLLAIRLFKLARCSIWCAVALELAPSSRMRSSSVSVAP